MRDGADNYFVYVLGLAYCKILLLVVIEDLTFVIAKNCVLYI